MHEKGVVSTDYASSAKKQVIKTDPLRYIQQFSICLRARDTSRVPREIGGVDQEGDDGNFPESLCFIVEVKSWDYS